MKSLQMIFMILFCILNRIRMKNIALQKKYLEKDETFEASVKPILAIETDNPNVSQLTSIGYDLIKKSFVMEQFDEGKLKQILFLNSLKFFLQLEHCVCQLIEQQEQFYIICVDGIKIFEEQNQIKKNEHSKTYTIQISLALNEICEEMLLNKFNQIIVYCQTKSKLILYRINLESQNSTKIIESNFDYNECQRKFINEHGLLYLAFYKCQNWVIYDISNEKNNLILNQEISKANLSQFQVSFNYSNNIYFCQSQIFLVLKKSYFMFSYKNQQLNFLNYQESKENEILYLSFEACKVQYIISENNNSNNSAIQFTKKLKEVSIKKGVFEQIQPAPQYLLLKKQSQLFIIITKTINQTFTILPSEIQFIQMQTFSKLQIYKPNLFYQFKSKRFIQFYQYYDLQETRKPQQKYLFTILPFNIFTEIQNSQITQYEVTSNFQEYFKLENENLFLKVETQNSCQSKIEGVLSKNQQHFPEFAKISSNLLENSNLISIKDEFDVSAYFFGLQKYQIKKILWIENQNQNFYDMVAFLTKDNVMFILNSHHRVLYQEEISGKLLFSAKNQACIIQLYSNNIKTIGYSQQAIFVEEKTFEDRIVSVHSCLDFLIILLYNEKIVIYDIKTQTIDYLDNQLYQFGKLICYFKYQSKIIIAQFEGLILYQISENIFKLFSFPNINIQEISKFSNGWNIKGIQNDDYSIVTFCLKEDSLMLTNYKRISVQNSIEFQKPMIVSSSKSIFAIASFQNKTKTIVIVVVKTYIKVVKIISVASFVFQQVGRKLFYQNFDNKLTMFNSENYYFTSKNIAYQSGIVDHYIEYVYLNYKENNQSQTIKSQIAYSVKNNCYNLMQLIDTITTQNQIFNLNMSSIFHGPIVNLAASKEFKLQGPFQISNPIEFCSEISIEFCKHVFQVVGLSNNFICIQNKIENQNYYCQSQLNSETFFLQPIQTKNESILFNLVLINSQYYFQVFEIENHFYLRLQQSIFLDYIYKALEPKEIIKIINDLVLIDVQNLKSSNYFFDLTNQIMLNHNIFDQVLDMQFINFSKQLYILLNKSKYESKGEILLVQVQNTEIKIIQRNSFETIQQNMFQRLLLNEYPDKNQLQYKMQFQKIKKSYQQNNTIIISIFVLLNHYYELEIKYDLLQNSTDYKILKVYRCSKQVDFKIHHFDETLLILKDQEMNDYYLYDLLSEKPMYDYFYKLQNFSKTIVSKINTTHYLFQEDENLFIGEFGFKVFIQDKNYQSKGYLIAKNDVSTIKVEIRYQEKRFLFLSLFQLLTGLLLVCLTFIFAGLILFLHRQSQSQKIKTIDCQTA